MVIPVISLRVVEHEYAQWLGTVCHRSYVCCSLPCVHASLHEIEHAVEVGVFYSESNSVTLCISVLFGDKLCIQ